MNSFIDDKSNDDKSKNPIQATQSSKTVLQPKSKPRWGLFGFLILLGIQGFLIYQVLGNKSQISESQNQIKFLTEEMTANFRTQGKKLNSVNTALAAEKKRIGETQQELNATKSAVLAADEQIRTEQRQSRMQQLQSAKILDDRISRKADNQELSALKSSAKTQFVSVTSNVSANKTEIENTKKTLEGARRDIVDVRSTLTQQIARNKEELKKLRLKGERNFYEFDIKKKQKFVLVGDIRIKVNKTNFRRQRYSVKIVVDDNTLERKKINVNQPVQFLVGPTKLRYELVVNEVRKKNRIIGYLSVPKDKALSSERRISKN